MHHPWLHHLQHLRLLRHLQALEAGRCGDGNAVAVDAAASDTRGDHAQSRRARAAAGRGPRRALTTPSSRLQAHVDEQDVARGHA